MRCERGQATIEWVGLVLLASLALAALVTALPASHEVRSFGPRLADRILCASQGPGCVAGDDAGQPTAGVPDDEFVAHEQVRDVWSRSGMPSGPRLGVGVGLGRGRDQLGPQQTRSVVCPRWWCDVVLRHCEAVFRARAGEAFCKARTAAAAEPNALAQFIEDRVSGCLVGAVGAKAFEPLAEELLTRAAARSPRDAWRALRRGLQRAREEVVKGKVKPGLVGCVGGAIGL